MTEDSRYHDAEVFATDRIEEVVKDGRLDFPQSTFAEAFVSWSSGVTVREVDGIRVYDVTSDIAEFMVDRAKTHSDFFDICAEICCSNLMAERGLDWPFRSFVTAVLLKQVHGRAARPAATGRKRSTDWLARHYVFSLAHQLAKEFGIPLTRNDEPNVRRTSVRTSASDAVTSALKVCGCKVSDTWVKNLLTHPDHARLREEFEAAGRIWHRAKAHPRPGNALRWMFDDDYAEVRRADIQDVSAALAKGKSPS